MQTRTVHLNLETTELLKQLQSYVDAKLQELPAPRASIGIGITTRNRREVFIQAFSHIYNHSRGCKIVVVDDASTTPVDPNPVNSTEKIAEVFRFDTSVGIAAAKNKCFELLEDCEHIFLFDDDTWPLVDSWYQPYIESKEPHLMYIFQDFSTGTKLNDTQLLYTDGSIAAYSHPRGCMCYFKRICLERVGGMFTGFGKWGYEHPDLSNRIFNNSLTTFRFMDVVGSNKLIYSLDEHEKVGSTVPAHGEERQHLIRRNKPIYESRLDNRDFIPYKAKEDILLTCYFNGAEDPQRGQHWGAPGNALQPLIESLKGLKLVILTDCLDDYKQDNVQVIRVKTGKLNPYFQRWISYRQYIQQNADRLNRVFCIDATDVQVLRNPFLEMEPYHLYVGDEMEVIANEWLMNHHKHPDFVQMYKTIGGNQLTNAGLCGGESDVLIGFMQRLIDFYCKAEEDHRKNLYPTAGLTDMAAFNWVVYTYFTKHLVHGLKVNTRFKANETNLISWFKHK
jgi:hypothetical protein